MKKFSMLTLRRVFCVIFLFVSAHVFAFEGLTGNAGSALSDGAFSTRSASLGNGGSDAVDVYTGALKVRIPMVHWQGNGHLPIDLHWYSKSDILSSPLILDGTAEIRTSRGFLCNNVVLPPTLVLSDGSSFITIRENAAANSTLRTVNGWKVECGDGAASPVAYRPDGAKLTFTGPYLSGSAYQTWYPSKLEMPNGESLQLQFFDGGLLKNVSASDGRILTVTNNNSIWEITAAKQVWKIEHLSAQVKNIIRPDGLAWKLTFYSGDLFGWKTDSVKRSQASMEEECSGKSPVNRYAFEDCVSKLKAAAADVEYKTTTVWPALLESITNPAGGSVNYQYSASNHGAKRYLWHKSSSDGAQWFYESFRPTRDGLYLGDNQQFGDYRRVITPTSIEDYNFTSPTNAFSSAEGLRWQMGLIKLKSYKDLNGKELERNIYTWTAAKISDGVQWSALSLDESYIWPEAAKTYAPVLSEMNVFRDGALYSTSSSYDNQLRPKTITESGDGASRYLTFDYENIPNQWRLDRVKLATVGANSSNTVSKVERFFDTKGNTAREVKNGVEQSYSYHATGDLATIKNPRGFITRLDDYYRGVPRLITEKITSGSEPAWCGPQLSEISTSKTVDDFGNVLSETDGRKKVTSYEYDALNRIKNIYPPKGNATRIDWLSNSRSLYRGNFTQNTIFDGFGRTTQSSKSNGAETINSTYRYDSIGQQVFASYPNAAIGESFEYDALGRLSKQIHANLAYREYGYKGSAVAVKDERTAVTSYFYRAMGNPDGGALVKIVPPQIGATPDANQVVTTDIVREIDDRVLSVTQKGITRKWEYDNRNYLSARIDPETGRTVLSRDAIGNITRSQLNNLPGIKYYYDAQNRAVATSYEDGSAENACQRFDAGGNRTSLENASTQRSYQYDDNENLQSETLKAASRSLSIAYERNANEALSAIVYPDQTRLELNPNGFGQPAQLGAWASQFTYNARGQNTAWLAANGRRDSTTFNEQGWPDGHLVNWEGGVVAAPVAPALPTELPIVAKPVAPVPPPAPGAQPNLQAPIAPVAPGAPAYGQAPAVGGAPGAPYAQGAPAPFNRPQPNEPSKPVVNEPLYIIDIECPLDIDVDPSLGEVAIAKRYGGPIVREWIRCRNDWRSRTAIWNEYKANLALYNADQQAFNNALAAHQAETNRINAENAARQAQYQQELARHQQDLAVLDAYNVETQRKKREYADQQARYQSDLNQYQQNLAAYNAAIAAGQRISEEYAAKQRRYEQDFAQYNRDIAAYNSYLSSSQKNRDDYAAKQAKYLQDLAAYQQREKDRVLIDSTWAYDPAGNVRSISDKAYPDWNRFFDYDEINRIARSDGPWGNGDVFYDGNGNITQQKFGAYQLNYGYDNVSQRLQTVSGAKSYNLQYDAYGNISSRGDGVSFTYDAAGSLRFSNKGAASQMAYQYDASGTRVLSAGNGINKLEFTAANGLLLYEINLNNNVATKHLYLGRNKLADIENGNVSYYHSDPIGSPLAATDASGNLLWRTSYRPYGERLTGGDGGKNKEWFGGKPYEDATGLSYFGARWYDPILGRFAAMDPVDWSEANPVHSFNRYGYANNNPYKFVDPDGRDPANANDVAGPHADMLGIRNQSCGNCVSGPQYNAGGHALESAHAYMMRTQALESVHPEAYLLGGGLLRQIVGLINVVERVEVVAKKMQKEQPAAPSQPLPSPQQRGLPTKGPANGAHVSKKGDLRVYDKEGNVQYDLHISHPHKGEIPHAHNWENGIREAEGWAVSILNSLRGL